MGQEITAEFIEDHFGKSANVVGFTRFCNAVVSSTTSGWSKLPKLSEKRGADGGIDGECFIPSASLSIATSSLLVPGWNVFQYKVRSISEKGRTSACSSLTESLGGALRQLQERSPAAKSCSQYILFTNLHLGIETPTKAKGKRLLQENRDKITRAILEGGPSDTQVQIVDAADLAGMVNSNPGLRATFFPGGYAHTWDEAWDAERSVKAFQIEVPLTGRLSETNALGDLLQDEVTKVIVIHGPSGIGKTRLALEATKLYRHCTSIVQDIDSLLRAEWQSPKSPLRLRVFLVEDPTEEQANQIARRAIQARGAKVIIILPTNSRAPAPILIEHPGVKIMSQLAPLTRSESTYLLTRSGISFDLPASDWVLLQAGGNPEILRTAVELQSKGQLRQKSGALKKALQKRICAAIQKELGEDAVRAIKTLSPLRYVMADGEQGEVDTLSQTIGMGILSDRVLELIQEFEAMGYLRKRGNLLSVTPPLFAACLVEELVCKRTKAAVSLFKALDLSGKERFIERLITAELREDEPFWDCVFEDVDLSRFASTDESVVRWVSSLARACPTRMANLLQIQVDHLSRSIGAARRLSHVMRELVRQNESCETVMKCLESLTLKELAESGTVREPNDFLECFVHWLPNFPLSLPARANWIFRLVDSSDALHRLLGVRIIAYATWPPDFLQGYSPIARRLGEVPERVTMSDGSHYLVSLIERRLDLIHCGDADLERLSLDNLESAIEAIGRYVVIADWLKLLGRVVEEALSSNPPISVVKLREIVHDAQLGCATLRHQAGNSEDVDRLAKAGETLEELAKRFDAGSFLTRVQVLFGCMLILPGPDGSTRHLFQEDDLRKIVSEATSNPKLMTEQVWVALRGICTERSNLFYRFLGEVDRERVFLTMIRSHAEQDVKSQTFGSYCQGWHMSSPLACEEFVSSLANDPAFPVQCLLWLVGKIGPTPSISRTAFLLLESKAVTPLEVADRLLAGDWLLGLATSELLKLLGFVGEQEIGLHRVIKALACYIGQEREFPVQLFPLARKVIKAPQVDDCGAIYFNTVSCAIAKAQLDEGFEIFEEHLALSLSCGSNAATGPWDPVGMRGDSQFWSYLRAKAPERAYRALLRTQYQSHWFAAFEPGHAGVLDLQNHGSILVRIVEDLKISGSRMASLSAVTQSGFFPFAKELIAVHGVDSVFSKEFAAGLVTQCECFVRHEAQGGSWASTLADAQLKEIPESEIRGWFERLAANLRSIADLSFPFDKVEPHEW